jgi:hypothetical protein
VTERKGHVVAGVETKSFDSPDETRTPEKTKIDVVQVAGSTAARVTFQPGWKWSECIKPVAGTDSCQARHVGTIISGKLHIEHEDGSQGEAGPGDVYVVEPGHNAWVVGDDPVIGFEFESKAAAEYAKG